MQQSRFADAHVLLRAMSQLCSSRANIDTFLEVGIASKIRTTSLNLTLIHSSGEKPFAS